MEPNKWYNAKEIFDQFEEQERIFYGAKVRVGINDKEYLDRFTHSEIADIVRGHEGKGILVGPHFRVQIGGQELIFGYLRKWEIFINEEIYQKLFVVIMHGDRMDPNLVV